MYNPRKAAQTVAFFAIKTGVSAINVLKVMKLVYLADRESIARYGFPILDERRVSMRNGPVNSITYDYIKGEVPPEYDCGWGDYVADRAGHDVGLTRADITIDELDELSDAEIETLEAVWSKFGGMDQWSLVRYTHDAENVPEWNDPKGFGSRTIPLDSLMAAVGVKDHALHAKEVESANRAMEFLKGL